MVAARRAPYAASATIFYGNFKVDLRWFWGFDECPAISGGNSEGIVFIVSFKRVHVAGVDLVGVSTGLKYCRIWNRLVDG